MAKYANQKTFIIKRNSVNKNTEEIYLCIYEKSFEKAMIELNGVAFKIYIYLMMNANNYQFDFSPQYLQDKYNFNRSSIYAALKELEEKSYIKKIENNKYIAYEIAPQATAVTVNEETIDCSIKTLPKENNNIPTFLRSTRKKKELVNYLDDINWDED